MLCDRPTIDAWPLGRRLGRLWPGPRSSELIIGGKARELTPGVVSACVWTGEPISECLCVDHSLIRLAQ